MQDGKGSAPYLVNAWGLTLSGNYAYVTFDTGLEIIDISNPATPAHKGVILHNEEPTGPFLRQAVTVSHQRCCKEYVSDGIQGRHSPFAKQFIDALEKGMGGDGILTLNEIMTDVETLKTAPQYGKFGDDKVGSDFVFVVKGD